MEITLTIEQFVRELRCLYRDHTGSYPDSQAYGLRSGVDRWIEDLYRLGLDMEEDKKVVAGMEITQHGSLALFHYADFSVIYGDWNPEEYWNAFGGIYRTCRSTVIDLDTGETVIKPFDKFFNIGELPETSIDTVENLIAGAKEIEISNKLDGSIFCVANRIVEDQSTTGYGLSRVETVFCTSQSLDPETSWHLAMGIDLYRNDKPVQDLMCALPAGTTVMFEMITKEDAHVVYYPSEMYGLHLIGVRAASGDLLKYSEVLELADKYGVKTTEIYDREFSEVMHSLDDKTSDEAEGFVIRVDDRYFKLKYNDYVKVHKTINRLVSANGVIEAFREGKIDDLISKVPQTYKEKIIEISGKISDSAESVRRVQQIAVSRCMGKDLKEQMLWIQKNVPKILQGRCISAVKNKDFGLFCVKNKTVRLKDIETIGNVSREWLARNENQTSRNRPSEYDLVYGAVARKPSIFEGTINSWEISRSESEEFSI